jgi:hypothetical protein
MFTGTIIEESLKDLSLLKDLQIISSKTSSDLEWNMHKVLINENQIEKLSESLNSGPWYMHFWNGDNIIVVFKDKTFHVKNSDKSTWKLAIDHGRSIGIPPEQLDFPTED